MSSPRNTRNIIKNERGTAIIEAAFALPLYFALLFGFVLWGLYFWERNTIQYAAFQTARCGALPVYTDTGTGTKKRHCGFDAVNYQSDATSLETAFGATKAYGIPNASSDIFAMTSPPTPTLAEGRRCAQATYNTNLPSLSMPSIAIFTANPRMGTVCFQP